MARNSSSGCASAPGLELEIIDRETEARFAARGCGSLADPTAESVLLFDIGGGSTELVWLTRAPRRSRRNYAFRAWTSLELGVVTLAEHFGGRHRQRRNLHAMTELRARRADGFRVGEPPRSGAARASICSAPPAR